MKHLLAACLWLLAGSAHAASINAKSLARFEAGYAKCEERFEHMRGQGDKAYLALWKLPADDKNLARVAALRKAPAYKPEKQAAIRNLAKNAGPKTDEKLKLQCQGTWAELQRNTKPKK